jgi:glycosyltransferase involved in cell wall biosynthesis
LPPLQIVVMAGCREKEESPNRLLFTLERSMNREPLVSVVTPVYNGARFLSECIESVISQDYTNWEYIIVNNCSTDQTGSLAEKYARSDPRIRVVENTTFLSCIDNYNNAFRQISGRSAYCKALAADDRLLPQCLGTMVRFAIEHATVGIVGSYQQSKDGVKWKGLPESTSVISGREACRLELLDGLHFFGNPTSLLYRSDLIRNTEAFFPHLEAHADTSACYAHLRDCEFGFIHKVLSVERVHDAQVSSLVRQRGADYLANIDILVKYGPRYLTDAELATRQEELLANYYRMLGAGLLKMKRKDFWEFHEPRLKGLGYSLDRRRVFIEAIRELFSELRSPGIALRKFKVALAERNRS